MVTIKDIAREGGVSVSTVSRALADSPLLPQATCVKIKEIATRLGYVKNEVASSLKRGASQTIGVLSFLDDALGFSHPLFADILEGIAKQLNACDYEILLLSDHLSEDADQLISSLRAKNLSGVLILWGSLQSQKVKKLIESDIPTVLIDGFDDEMTAMTNFVTSTNEIGMYDLTKEILRKGHTNIVYLCGNDYYVTRERIKGFCRALQEQGITYNDSMFHPAEYYHLSNVKEIIEQLLARKNPPTCMIFPDDYCAVTAYGILRDKGYTIGKDISVAGFDGLGIGQYAQPRLTTVNQDMGAVGKRAADVLLQKIRGDAESNVQFVPTKLIIGESICDLT